MNNNKQAKHRMTSVSQAHSRRQVQLESARLNNRLRTAYTNAVNLDLPMRTRQWWARRYVSLNSHADFLAANVEGWDDTASDKEDSDCVLCEPFVVRDEQDKEYEWVCCAGAADAARDAGQ